MVRSLFTKQLATYGLGAKAEGRRIDLNPRKTDNASIRDYIPIDPSASDRKSTIALTFGGVIRFAGQTT